MSNLSVSPSQTDVERREAERETTLRYMAAQGFALMPMDALFLLSEIERLRGALHESRKDRQALVTRKVYPDSDITDNGVSDTQHEVRWWAIEGEGHSRVFATADEALAAFHRCARDPDCVLGREHAWGCVAADGGRIQPSHRSGSGRDSIAARAVACRTCPHWVPSHPEECYCIGGETT